jgi:LuxR family transcriptional regulator, maltose regulon positive regulatory protein
MGIVEPETAHRATVAGTARALPADWREAADGLTPALAAQLLDLCEVSNRRPAEAARAAEQLFPLVREQAGLAPWLTMVIAITGRIHSLSRFRGLDVFLEYFEQQHHRLAAAPPGVRMQVEASYFGALVFRQPDHPRIAHWADVCLQAFESEGDALPRLHAANFLLLHRIWNADFIGADALRCSMVGLRERTEDVRAQLLCHSISAIVLRMAVDYAGCHREIEQGLLLADRSGIHFWDSHFFMQGAALALSRENLEEAGEWLERMEGAAPPEHCLDRSGYHYMRAWRHVLANEPASALQHCSDAVRLAAEAGARYPEAITRMALAQIHLDHRRLRPALGELRRARQIALTLPRHRGMQFARGLAHAHISFKLGMRKRGRRALAKALSLGAQEGYLNFPWWRSDFISALCARALEADIEPEYVRWLIGRRRLRPPENLASPEKWHWPLTIALLGTPCFILDGQPLDVTGKSSSILLALAALADPDGWVGRDRLADRLWPDSDGDRAQRALDTAIHRLRRQLGSEAMVVTRPGGIALNPALCRVDYWWLQRTLATETVDESELEQLVEAARALDNASPDAAALLDLSSLQRRIVLKVLAALDGRLSGAPQVERWLESLLDALPGHERLWQALIRFYSERGLASDALAAWSRCRLALRHASGLEPSVATYRLVKHWLEVARAGTRPG